jgi:flavin-binding protein dodecin
LVSRFKLVAKAAAPLNIDSLAFLERQSLRSTIEDAVNKAITRAGKTIRNMKWFEVGEVRGHLENNKVADWQVTVKVGFTLDT